MMALLSRLYWRRFLRRNACPWTEVEHFDSLNPDERRRQLAGRLLEQIRYFGNRADALPEWKEAAHITDPAELWSIWIDLPIITKAMLRDRFPAAEIRNRFHIEGQIKSSGGSTGEPTQFFHDVPMLKRAVAGNVYTRLRMGWRPGMATLIVWGSERDIGKKTGNWESRTVSWLLQEYILDGYHLTEATVGRVLDIVRTCSPVAIYGFTSMLEYVAKTVLECGTRPAAGGVRTAWNGGEMLHSEQSRVFEQAFGVPILNRYGGRELSTIACQYQAGRPLNVLRPWVFLESVDEQGRPTSPGQTGRLLLTSTVCRGTPFLRYDIEDLGVYEDLHCDESGISALSGLQGRHAGLMTLPDGRTINNLYWNHLFKEFPEVRQFQVTYKRNGEIWISLAGDRMTNPREAHLREMTGHLLAGIPIKLCWTHEIPRTVQGKLLQVLREPEDFHK